MRVRRILGCSFVVALLPATVAHAQSSGSQVYVPQVSGAPLATTQRDRAVYDSLLQAQSVGNGATAGLDSSSSGHNSQTSNNSLSAMVAGASAGSLSPNQAGNVAILNQIGSGNQGTINQAGSNNSAVANVFGSNNGTTQLQSGAGNASSLGVLGSGNAPISTTQTGNYNSAAYDFIGNNNSLTSTQTGTGLSYGLTVVGSGKNITVSQQGIGTGATTATAGLPTAGMAGIPTKR